MSKNERARQDNYFLRINETYEIISFIYLMVQDTGMQKMMSMFA
jgi:hypothetical protein